MVDLKTENAELIEQINSLQKAYGRMVDENAEEKRELRTQLAKANERVVILEKERDHAQRMYNSLLGDLSAGYGALSIPECESQLNKFAIEQQIGVLNELAEADKDGTKHVYYRCLSKIEQLRKEQE